MSTQPWELGNHPGPVKNAKKLTVSAFKRLIQEPESTLLIVGSTPSLSGSNGEPREDGKFVLEMAELLAKKGVVIAATLGGYKILNSRNIKVQRHAGIVQLCKKLSDKDWDYFGQEIKIVIMAGLPHYLQSQALSALRHNAPHVRTISLDPYYSPNADFSSPTVGKRKKEEWFNELKSAV
ncbi:MAG: carbon monoxide dehydrogenase beta subunit family protein [Candidatus Hermodarchaeota archaeon]